MLSGTRQSIPEPVELITVDVSYLSLAAVAPQLEVLTIAEDADLVGLVKPVYELGLRAPPQEEAARQNAVERAVAGAPPAAGKRLGGRVVSTIGPLF